MVLTAASIAIVLSLALAGPAPAQDAAPTIGPRLRQDTAIEAALEAIRADEPRTLQDQARICEVEAPPFKEMKRGELYAQLLREAGLTNVRTDKEGNVLGELIGAQPRPHLVFAAHLDTVFPEGTDVRVTREGTVMRGPGIGDDCRGLAVVLAVARTMVTQGIKVPGTITFVGNVGEEGLGDLRGVKYLFHESMKGRIDRFVSVDGTGYGITHIAVGSLRYRVTFKGPGGHSYGAFGRSNPLHALGRAVETISDFEVPLDPKTTFNVGRIGGGTSVNSIPFDAWMEVDMRSADASALQLLDTKFHKAVDDAVRAEDARWNQRMLSVDKALVGNRPAGRTAAEAPIVRAAVSVTEALGLPVSLDEGSTDSNLPMSLGIPAITIDGGGRGRDAHALTESFDSTDSWKGTQRALLLAIALAQP
ncbi:MAG: M20/M25/M40 family metallo-hydrolase [Acidobacteria bacterium]|nr:M20/M25/M40 family metallo-hydrolase [Acidobacteriota bacterium]